MNLYHDFLHPGYLKIMIHLGQLGRIAEVSDIIQTTTFLSYWLIDGLGWLFGFLGSPYERDFYLGAIESQTTNPNHQSTISWTLTWHIFGDRLIP